MKTYEKNKMQKKNDQINKNKMVDFFFFISPISPRVALCIPLSTIKFIGANLPDKKTCINCKIMCIIKIKLKKHL